MQVVRYGLPGGLPGLVRGPRSTNCASRTARYIACHGASPDPALEARRGIAILRQVSRALVQASRSKVRGAQGWWLGVTAAI